MKPICPLCQSADTYDYAADKQRRFLQCTKCSLVFAEPGSWPSPDTEKAEYDLHENDVNDAGYNRFLSRIVEPLNQRLPEAAKILDFGCGPAPALANQLRALGHQLALYDLFYYPNSDALTQQYDAIVMTEVIEHLHQPAEVVQQLWQQLNSQGVLAIMTQRVIDQDAFSRWQYKNDPTHVCFYSDATFHYLAQSLSAQLDFVGRDMVFLKQS